MWEEEKEPCGRTERWERETGQLARQPQEKAERVILVCETFGIIHLMLLEMRGIKRNRIL